MGPGGAVRAAPQSGLIGVVVRRGIDVMWMAQPPIQVAAGRGRANGISPSTPMGVRQRHSLRETRTTWPPAFKPRKAPSRPAGPAFSTDPAPPRRYCSSRSTSILSVPIPATPTSSGCRRPGDLPSRMRHQRPPSAAPRICVPLLSTFSDSSQSSARASCTGGSFGDAPVTGATPTFSARAVAGETLCDRQPYGELSAKIREIRGRLHDGRSPYNASATPSP
jgi:hypothetical protein